MMKMTTEIKQHYFEFSPRTGAVSYSLIAAKDKAEAIEVYYRDISESAMEPKAGCKQISSAKAWKKCRDCDDIEGQLSIEEKLEEFEGPGVILWPRELIQ